MEDSDQLSKRVASQANEVAKIAEGTKDVVATGFVIIKESLEKMESIKDANELSIRGIRELGDKIERIWDIVNIINGIADQTKIIAFNAELEAASAGEAGKSFQIVATEIRRLADSTVNSTNEIKARINEIQKSSDHLILSSEEGTSKIIAGWELSNKLRNLFGDILQTSEVSSDSARQIALSIEQQVVAFDQILITLKQISSGIDNFVTSTTSTSRLTRVLMDMSVDLHQVVAKYDEKPEN
jgi:methyl-accepting chemotaxis protein